MVPHAATGTSANPGVVVLGNPKAIENRRIGFGDVLITREMTRNCKYLVQAKDIRSAVVVENSDENVAETGRS